MRQKPLIFVLVCALAAGVSRNASAAQRPAQRPADQTAAQVNGPVNADDTRDQLEDLLKQYPPSLPQVLKLDPTLLQNGAYLQLYPALASFLEKHPEVGHNPMFFFADYGNRGEAFYRQTPNDRTAEAWRSFMDGFEVMGVVLTIASGILLLLKMVIDYRRWSRLTKIQTEAHTKLLDRFTSNEDLLAYAQSPAGRKFLESTPIAVDSPRSLNAPFGRILWAAQAGAVLTVLGIGVELIARQAVEEVAGPIGAVGALVIALGVGFVISAVVAYFLSRRFGLVQPFPASEPRG
jgi:hypothetical protein